MQLATSVEYRQRVGASTASEASSTIAVGLILGYGAIAVHGMEGFRAGLASVACIFSDAPQPLDAEHADLRRAVADEYGVPCITLDAAISIGFLSEMGVELQAIERLRSWIAAGRPLVVPQPSMSVAGTQLTGIELRIARMIADGLTNAEIARSVGLNSRLVEFHIRRIVERLGPGRPPQRAA